MVQNNRFDKKKPLKFEIYNLRNFFDKKMLLENKILLEKKFFRGKDTFACFGVKVAHCGMKVFSQLFKTF